MTPGEWFAYGATVLVLMSTPGPSHLLMLSNSLSAGFARSLATASGDLSANALQMTLAGLGVTVVLGQHPEALEAVKWAGVAYLLGIGLCKAFGRASKVDAPTGIAGASLKRLWGEGFVTSLVNPKAIVFFAALFPQFIDPGQALWPQWFALAATYLAIDGIFLAIYGSGAGFLRTRVRALRPRTVNAAAAASMVLAAMILAMKEVA